MLEEEVVEPSNIKILTEKLYSSFNGIGTVKSIEYTGKREIGQDVGVQTAMRRRTAARAAKWRGRRDTSDAHQQLRALRKLELIEEIQAGFLREFGRSISDTRKIRYSFLEPLYTFLRGRILLS